MSKIIKREIKRSAPWLLILTMISMSVAGFVFNFDINFIKLSNNDKVELSIEMNSAEAQDTATTSVTVKNAPPDWAINPTEIQVSSSTSPRNNGGTIGFTAQANDPENHSYYLAICSSDSITASTTGGAPTCDGTEYCVSGLTADETSASCNYNPISTTSEVVAWYAFICDNHSSEAACNPSSQQGSGDSGSPFYVNHAPILASVSTTDDNKVPGANFTITALVTDTDTQGGADTLNLAVCSTNSWATSTGCAATTICTGASSTPNVSCIGSTTIPTADQAYNYWAFVYDWHDMNASGNSKTNTYTVINVAPTVAGGSLNNGSSITLGIKGAPGTVVWATSTTVVDNNGCSDITSATGTLYYSGVSGGYNCSTDNNFCYPITSGNCTISSCSGAQATVACTATLEHYAVTTADGTGPQNPYAAGNWLASFKAFDDNGATGVGTTSPGQEVNASTALDVTEADIPYGVVQSGANTGNINATTTVVNAGNTPLNSGVIGQDMFRNASTTDFKIPADQQEYATSTFAYGAADYTLASTGAPFELDIDAQKPTSASNIEDQVFWGIAIPAAKPSGDYYGQNTFSAILDSAGNWN